MMDEKMTLAPGLTASWRSMLSQNIGKWVAADFLVVGTGRLVHREGVLYAVGNDYLVLCDEDSYLSADLYALKFAVLRENDT